MLMPTQLSLLALINININIINNIMDGKKNVNTLHIRFWTFEKKG